MLVNKWKSSVGLLVCVLFGYTTVNAADIEYDRVFNPTLKTLQTSVNGQLAASQPVITLEGSEHLTVSFDILGDDREYLCWRLLHCDADWQLDNLSDTDYLPGFNYAKIENHAFSRATNVHYVHYWFTLPSDDMQPQLSGNYLLQIFTEDNPDDVWAQCRVKVDEGRARIAGSISGRTDVDFNREHQQLTLSVEPESGLVSDPYGELYVVIEQNSRPDTRHTMVQPLRLDGQRLIYEHQPELIFPAGNEYRRSEFISTQWGGMGVDRIDYINGSYVVRLQPDAPRVQRQYSYDRTQQGRYVVRRYDSDQPQVDADYVLTDFTLRMPEDPSLDIYIEGELTGRSYTEANRMQYDSEAQAYRATLLLKQGAYNYQYVGRTGNEVAATTAEIEGNKYQTQNDYNISVYYRPHGRRYDRLIGTATISGQPQ